MKLGKINASHVQKFVNNLAPKIINYHVAHSINKRILRYGVTLQLIPYNPADNIVLPKKAEKWS